MKRRFLHIVSVFHFSFWPVAFWHWSLITGRCLRRGARAFRKAFRDRCLRKMRPSHGRLILRGFCCGQGPKARRQGYLLALLMLLCLIGR